MSFIKISDPRGLALSLVEQFSLELHPKRTFTSASSDSLAMPGGVTGSIPLQARSTSGSIKLNLEASAIQGSLGYDASTGHVTHPEPTTADLHAYQEGESSKALYYLAQAQMYGSATLYASRSVPSTTENPSSAEYDEAVEGLPDALSTYMDLVMQ